MLSWVVKVVPQLPQPSIVEEQKEAPPPASAPPLPTTTPPVTEKKVKFQDECKNEALKAAKLNQQAAEENSPAPGSQPGVLMWISGALPQPAVSPKLSRANSTTKKENTTTRTGMMAWIAQGLEKVVPQPDVNRKETPPAQPPTEVRQTAAATELQVTVVEVGSTREDNKPLPPRMIDWIKQGLEKVVPQPEIHVRSKTEVNEKTDAPASTAVEAPKPAPAPKPAADTENMMGWIVSEFGRMLPQPVQKQDADSDEVQNINIVQRKTDLVLEEMGQDEDKEVKEMEKEVRDESQKTEDLTGDAAVTKVDQCSPPMDIKTEAGEEVLVHMEDRLQQDHLLEAARVAEEMARKAAEEAVRQLEVEHSRKIIIETLPESNEQLPNILEEENEDDPELQNLQEESEDSTDNRSSEENKVTEGNNQTAVARKSPLRKLRHK
ncbi:hypothetical protein VZT92_000042 [Zoarces viviparus]|uniref:Uncharacterized protein n=1 Tax=Zoarces viviparus TaxID=48416 RepID=A0AAW1G6G4_ZOAVI